MKGIKILLLLTIFVLSSFMVSALNYEPNQTIQINAIYSELGIYTDANANITIFLPDGNIAVNNVAMNDTSTGLFYYDYLIPSNIGTYDVEVRFYNLSGSILGLDTGYFEVTVNDRLELGVCPDTDYGRNSMWIIIGICVILGIVGIFSRIIALLLVSAFGLIFCTLIVWNCGVLIGYITLILGLVYLIIAVTMKPLT